MFESETLGIKVVEGNPKTLAGPEFLSVAEARAARRFHMTVKGYEATPLAALPTLAKRLGVKGVFVKDESYRFGLNAFKVLGGSYAIAKVVCQKLGRRLEDTSFDELRSPEVQAKIKDVTFTTATDGNHGRGVAWAAAQLGVKAVIYLPKGSAQRRVDAILETGQEAHVLDVNYDDAVRYSLARAQENGWTIIQDTAWEGYDDIPRWIMQGYATMADEASDQLRLFGVERPTHVFLQAGVGSMSGAVAGYFVNQFPACPPKTVVVEPENAACIFLSAQLGDGEPHNVGGDLQTVMAGLACGEPNPIGWEILRDFSTSFVSCPDYVAGRGVRLLANPLPGDTRVTSGESGAVGPGLLSLLMERPELDAARRQMGLDETSVVLFFSTEGDTDPVSFRRVLWDGLYPVPAA
ncbi:MAG: diaminopropionate ammonia-lyase [Deltaproteobacteria bacterium]|nr:diaminopropionate ammonia-lyase [Deltaproteobacteria bacterium]